MSVRRKTAEDFRARINNGLPAKLLRNQPGAVCGSIWTLAAEALEQLAKPPDPARTWARSKLVERLKSRVAELEFAVSDLESERDKPPPATVTDVVWKGRAALLAADVARLEAIVSRALDLASDLWSSAPGPIEAALADELHRAGLFDADDGTIKPAGHALQLRAATTAPTDPARAERVYVAGGSAEVELVARYIDALRAAGVEVTYDWTADVLAWRTAGSPPLTAEQRAAHARADLEGIERADLVWWILPAALSEGSAFEAGFAHGLALALARLGQAGPRLVVSGDRAAHGRVFPELAAERWESHEAALAAIVSLAAERRQGGAP